MSVQMMATVELLRSNKDKSYAEVTNYLRLFWNVPKELLN